MTDRVVSRGILRPRIWLVGVCCLLFFTAGCKVGPDYLRPQADVADDWIDSQHTRLQGEPVDSRYWWTAFNDPCLHHLIERAHSDNLTVREAGMRVLEARSNFGYAAGSLFPQSQQLTGDYQHAQVSRNRPNFPNIPGFNRQFDDWQLGFTAAWEFDFWGRFRRGIAAARAELDASVENHDDVLVILLGDTAATYIEIRTIERRIQLAKENADIQRRTLQLVRNRLDAGTVTELDYAESETNLRDTEAAIPRLERFRREANNRMCVLLGTPAHDLTPELGDTGNIPHPPETLAVNLPADLLRRRPDVRRAERHLAAQSERIGIATAEFYPHLSLNGIIGLESAQFDNLFNSSSWGGTINPSFRWNILNYGRLRNNVQAQEARFQQLAYNYRNTVLKANAEVENALFGFIKSHEQVESLSQSAKAARRAVELSFVRYEGGRADFNEVFILQAQLVRKLDAVAEIQGELAKSFVGIYRGLGGGWEIRLGNAPPFVARADTPPAVEAPMPQGAAPPVPAVQPELDNAPPPPVQKSELPSEARVQEVTQPMPFVFER